jgi:P pilus assembly chaperone PapD
MSSNQPAPQPRLHYAYVVAGVAFVLLIAAAGVRSSPTKLIQPLEKEFGSQQIENGNEYRTKKKSETSHICP